MKVRPILFSGPMVKAILEGRKTVTRRVVKPQPDAVVEPEEGFVNCTADGIVWGRQRYQTSPDGFEVEVIEFPVRCPYGAPGDRLVVAEQGHCIPRLVLDVVSVSVQRLNDISDEDADAEGCPGWYVPCHPDLGSTDGRTPKEEFADLWHSLYGKRPGCSWADNPWVWAVSFRKLD